MNSRANVAMHCSCCSDDSPSGPVPVVQIFDAFLQSGNANFEEFVKVGAGDAQKAQSFQQRQIFACGLRQYATVKIEKRKLPIDIEFRCPQVDVRHRIQSGFNLLILSCWAKKAKHRRIVCSVNRGLKSATSNLMNLWLLFSTT